jgi:hypothetical protein
MNKVYDNYLRISFQSYHAGISLMKEPNYEEKHLINSSSRPIGKYRCISRDSFANSNLLHPIGA